MKSAKIVEPKTSWENPLIPSKLLRQLYAAMVELRLLEEHISKPQRRKSALCVHHGEEACLASTILSLQPGDLTSESAPGLAIEFLRGAKMDDFLHRTSSIAKSHTGELPPLEDTTARLHLALGAATALASQKKNPLVAAFVHAGDLALSQWKPILKLAGTHAAPILFIVLPGSEKSSKSGQLSLASTSCGVPGIAVDASDPIALYRVVQESILRIRAGGGPVLMECIQFQLPARSTESSDPVRRMQQLLLPRGIATEAWFDQVAARFKMRLQTAAD